MHREHLSLEHSPLSYLWDQFTAYIEDCRAHPRDDVLTGLALATFPDGTLPPVEDVMKIAANLFAAGQETTARLLSSALKTIGDRPEIQQQLRDHRELVPVFIEEMLRLESPIKGTFRLAKVPTVIAGTEIPAGSTVMVLPSAATGIRGSSSLPRNCDSTGPMPVSTSPSATASTCAGAPLARAEAVVSVQRFFDRTEDIRISETHHGPVGDRHWQYSPTWMLRGLDELHLEFSPIG